MLLKLGIRFDERIMIHRKDRVQIWFDDWYEHCFVVLVLDGQSRIIADQYFKLYSEAYDYTSKQIDLT